MTPHRREMIYVLSFAVLNLIAGIITLIARKMYGIPFIVVAAFMFLLFLRLHLRKSRCRSYIWCAMAIPCDSIHSR